MMLGSVLQKMLANNLDWSLVNLSQCLVKPAKVPDSEEFPRWLLKAGLPVKLAAVPRPEQDTTKVVSTAVAAIIFFVCLFGYLT